MKTTHLLPRLTPTHLLRRTFLVALIAAVLAAAAVSARADKIRETSGIGHDGQIVGLRSRGIVIRETAGDTKEVPLSQIREISSDQYPALAKAEQAYAKGLTGDAASLATAEAFYKTTAASTAAPQWLRLLSQCRMFRVYAESGRLPLALDAYIDLANADPGLVAGLKLPPPSPGATDVNTQLLKKVETALRAAGDKPYTAELRGLQLALVGLSGKPEDALTALAPLLKSSDEKVRFPAMFERIKALFALNRADEASAQLNEAVGVVDPEAYGPDLAYWKGRVYKVKNQNLDAALEFMKVAILYPGRDRARTAESLWYAGQALEGAKATKPEIRRVYQEAVDKYAGTPGAEKAKVELARLGA